MVFQIRIIFRQVGLALLSRRAMLSLLQGSHSQTETHIHGEIAKKGGLSVQFSFFFGVVFTVQSHLFISPIGARTLKMPVPYPLSFFFSFSPPTFSSDGPSLKSWGNGNQGMTHSLFAEFWGNGKGNGGFARTLRVSAICFLESLSSRTGSLRQKTMILGVQVSSKWACFFQEIMMNQDPTPSPPHYSDL